MAGFRLWHIKRSRFVFFVIATMVAIYINFDVSRSAKVSSDTNLSYTEVEVDNWNRHDHSDDEEESTQMTYEINSTNGELYVIGDGVTSCVDFGRFALLAHGDMITVGQIENPGIIGFFRNKNEIFSLTIGNHELLDMGCIEEREDWLRWIIHGISVISIWLLYRLFRASYKSQNS